MKPQLENKIKTYFESLKPEKLGLKNNPKASYVKKIGMGMNNANFLVIVNGKKFIFRLNVLLSNKIKSKTEFNTLKMVEKLNIAPKAWIFDDSKKVFDSEFMILSYIEGEPLEKTNFSLNKEFIEKLANLCVEFHLVPLKEDLLKLPKDEIDYRDLLKGIKKKYDFIAERTSDKEILNILFESYENLRKKCLKRKDNHPLVLAHGDFQIHNLIIHRGKLRLIDFESLGITEPAVEIAYILTQFSSKIEFNEKQKEIFIEEYLKHRKDSSLRERVDIFIPLKNFSDLLWAIGQILRVKEGHMHREFLTKDTLKDTIDYSQMVFGRCLRCNVINKKYRDFNLEKVIK